MKDLFLYRNGLKKMAKQIQGTEKVHIGIRPLGFHAGNKMALLVYPYLLCEEFEKTERRPAFQFFISLNDFEPNELKYLEKSPRGKFFYKKISAYGDNEPTYGSNIFCEETSIGNIPDHNGCCPTIVDHYEKVIQREVDDLFSNRFPSVKFRFVRNSELLSNIIFQKYLKLSIENPDEIAKIIQSSTNQAVLTDQAHYAGAVCPSCKKADGKTLLADENKIEFNCHSCGKVSNGGFEDFDYWIYHKPLLIPRLLIFKIDLCIRGGDHYQAGNVNVTSALLKRFEPGFNIPMTLITPVIVDEFGRKLSKSYGNTIDIPTRQLLDFARKANAPAFGTTQILGTTMKNS